MAANLFEAGTLQEGRLTVMDESGLLPGPLNLGEISRMMDGGEDGTGDGGNPSMVQLAEQNHVVSDRKFGSFWNYQTQGRLMFNTFNTCAAGDPPHVLSPEGPGMRFLRFMPGVRPINRPEQQAYYTQCQKACADEANRIQRYLKRANCVNYPIYASDAETSYLFRLTNSTNEPDDEKLKQKIKDFQAFVVHANGVTFSKTVSRHKVRGVEKPRKYPATFADIDMPPMRAEDGSVVEPAISTEDASAELEDMPDEYIPEIARDRTQQYMVFAMYTTPTVLNCVDESKYLRENMPNSPVGADEYDEAILIQPMQAFPDVKGCQELKDNFAKHALLTASIHIVSMNERVSFLNLFTEQTRNTIPRTYRKETVQTAAVDIPKAMEIKRELAASAGVEMVHLGPEQTEAEAKAAMAKLEQVARANERIAKTNEMFRKLAEANNPETAQRLEPVTEEDEGGGGGSKE